MPTSEFTFESGEPIRVGSHGTHDYVFESGVEVTDSGGSSLVFESGEGLGGQLPDGVKYRWDFEESGAPYVDSINGVELTVQQGSPTPGVSTPNGQGVSFDGDDGLGNGNLGQIAEYPTGDLTLPSSFTVTLVVNSTAGNSKWVEWWDDNEKEKRFTGRTDAMEHALAGGSNGPETGLTLGEWEVHTMVQDGSTQRGYRNGNKEIDRTLESDSRNSTSGSGFTVGYDGFDTPGDTDPPHIFAEGTVDAVIYWGRALSDSEAEDVYAVLG